MTDSTSSGYETRIEGLHEATRELMTAETKQEVAECIAEAAKEILDFPRTVVRFLDDGRLVSVVISEEVKRVLGPDRPTYEIGQPTAGLAFERGETLVYDDLSRQEFDDDIEHSPGAGMYVPIGEHGVLTVADIESDTFDDADVKVAEILATNAETALNRVERIQNLEEFASLVSHDLRNPLNVAELRLEMAREEGELEHLDAVARAHERMDALIEDLLTLARDGEPVTDFESVDLADIVEGCWRNVDTAEATLVTDTDSVIRADQGRLQQLLENLIRNAVEHSGEDVTVTIGDLDDETGFYVEDDGPGIPEDKRDVVFEAGYSTTDDGTGFGLNIAKEIAEAHGWDVRVTDSEAGGARFEFTDVEFV